MITVLRRYCKSGSKVVLWIIMAAFVIGLAPGAFRSLSQAGKWAIRVNGQDIASRDFAHEMRKQQQQIMAFRAQYGEYADWLLSTMGMNDPKGMAYRSLVKEELINQFGQQLGIYLNPEYVSNQMNNPEFVTEHLAGIVPPQIVDKMGGINHQLLRQYLQYTGMSSDMFERQIERALMEGVVQDLVAASLYVPLFDIQQKYHAEHAKKTFSIFKIDTDRVGAYVRKTPLADGDLERFYREQNDQSKRYWVPEKRGGSMWSFHAKNYEIPLSDEQLESYYEKHKVKEFIDKPATVQVRRILFKVPNEASRASVQDRIGRLRDEILPDPSSFEKYAREQSEDAGSAAQGGMLEPFTRGSHEHIFDKTAFLLKKDGDISSVIETKDGYEMLQRVSKKPQQFKPFSSVKKEIKEALIRKKFATQFGADMKKIIRAQEDGSDDTVLQALIAQKGAKAEAIAPASADKTERMEHLFKLKKGGLAFYVDGDTGVVVQLDTIQERYEPTLESIRSTVQDDYYAQKAGREIASRLDAVRKDLEAKKSFAALQKQFDGTVMQTGWLSAKDQEALAPLEKQGVPVSQMLQLEKPEAVLTHQNDQGGFVVRLDEISPLDTAQFEADRKEFSDSYTNDRLRQYMEGFVASLHRNATIETNESLVTIQD